MTIDFKQKITADLLSVDNEEMTDRQTGELIKYHRLHLVTGSGLDRKVLGLTCGSKPLARFAEAGGKPGKQVQITVVPRAQRNRVKPGVLEILPL